ncbi:hypothetical protein CF168_11640 [Shewanella bicestrii]|uniref:Uncharacterized protein n=1 Tax=Shewanella bicestrii TaxID=2018305 RepID=A0A220UMR0_9GAMM|nr:hypothetical protein [Shewanella bicestrii]ASK69468.1 hypothetical protein CF168_11640 [Shewanella bicestrii]
MFDHLAVISGDWVTDLLISVTLILFIFFSVREYVATSQAKALLSQLAELKSNSDSGRVSISNLDKSVLVWVTDHLIYKYSDNEIEIESKDGMWLSKSPVSQLLPSFDTNRHKLVPALLTSIGITGTFLGITLGLSQFSMAGDSKALLASAAELLEGMKTAFYTSLAGLSTSALFMSVMKYSSSVLVSAQQNFLQRMATQYFEASPVYYLKSMSNDSQQELMDVQIRSAQAMESIGLEMKEATASLSDFSDSFNSDKLAAQISDSFSVSIEKSMTPVLESIQTELETLREIKEQSQKELVQLLIADMRDQLINPLTLELDKTSSAVMTSNEIAVQLNSNLERVVTSTSETVATINEFQKETMLKLQSFAVSLKDILSSFKEDTQGAMSTIAAEVNSMLQTASSGMDAQRQAFELSAQRASTAFEGMKDSLEDALDVRQQSEQKMFTEVTNRIDKLLEQIYHAFEDQTKVIKQTGESASSLLRQAQTDFEISVQQRRDEESALFSQMQSRISDLVDSSQAVFKEQANSIKQIGIDASDVMASAKTELQQGLGDIDTKVKSMSDTVQRELEAFRLQYQQNLTAYFEEQNNLLDNSLSKQRNGLNEVVDNFRNVFESEYKARHTLLQELTAQYQKLEASAATLERVAKAIGLNDAAKMAELQDAATTMGREIAMLKKEYAAASKTFIDITENLPKAMDEYFSRANESFETFFNDFDTSASKIHNKLSQAAGYLVNAQVQRREFEANEVNA